MEITELLHKPNQIIKENGKLTHNQLKLYDCILSNVKVKEGKLDYSLNYTNIKKLSGIDDKNNSRVSGYIRALKDYDIEFSDDRGNWGCFSLLSEYRKIDDVIEIVLPKAIVLALLNGNYYTTVDLLKQKLLTRKYSIFLYQYLKRNLFRGDIFIDITTLKNIFGIQEKKAYSKNFTLLKKKILIPSMEEINSIGDFTFSTKDVYMGRGIIGIDIKYTSVICNNTINEILMSNDLQKIIDKILTTDLIHIEGKRVKRKLLETSINDLIKQHKNEDLIIKSLKSLVKENKKTVSPKCLKSYIWSIAKTLLEDNKVKDETSLKTEKIEEVTPVEKPNKIVEEDEILHNIFNHMSKDNQKLTEDIAFKNYCRYLDIKDINSIPTYESRAIKVSFEQVKIKYINQIIEEGNEVEDDENIQTEGLSIPSELDIMKDELIEIISDGGFLNLIKKIEFKRQIEKIQNEKDFEMIYSAYLDLKEKKQ